jgi:hypothetical protein
VEECGQGKKRGIGSNKMAQKKEQEKRMEEMKKEKRGNKILLLFKMFIQVFEYVLQFTL